MKNPILYDNGHFDCGSATDGTDQTECFTLRDWFAGKALEGLLANQEAIEGIAGVMRCRGSNDTALDMAKASYELADAMLMARGCHEA